MNVNVEKTRSVVETASPGTIAILFVAVIFMLIIGIVGTFIISANSLSVLVAGIIFLTAFVITMIFRQVVLEIDDDEVALSWGTERVWISKAQVASVEPFEMTGGRRFAALVALGPWSAVGKEKIHYYGQKGPMVLIVAADGGRYAVSVENTDRVIGMLSTPSGGA